MDDKLMPTLQSRLKLDPEKGRSRLLSPNPNRIKYVTEVLAALGESKITFASVMRLDRKKMSQLAEQGYTKLKYGRYNDARKIFEILAFVDHKNYFHHLALGGAYHKMKKFLDAAFQYTECLKYDPENINALVNRGEIFLKHKNYKKAAEDFRAAILLDKEGRDIFANRARSLVIAIKRSIAKDKGQDAVKLPQSPSRRKKIAPVLLMGRKKRQTKK
ncbi:MAG: tetratricopeptide repeat protein [Deltaproteobacteria bacterium]|nr:tetratricopeptide repeat protein [Deltaproteobacteria bacterium]